jgi:hypothetical protein
MCRSNNAVVRYRTGTVLILNNTVRYGTVPYGTVPYGTVPYDTVQYMIIEISMVSWLHGMAQWPYW